MNTQTSLSSFSDILERANQYIAGGVVSLNGKVIPNIVFRRGKGSKIYDTDNISGTYNAHPVNTAAAIAALGILSNPDIYTKINQVSNILYGGLEQLFFEKGIAAVVSRNASAYCVYFTKKVPADLHDILENVDFEFDLKYRRTLIEKGIYNIPIPCKQGSISVGRWSLVVGRWSLIVDRWSLIVDRWSLVVGR